MGPDEHISVIEVDQETMDQLQDIDGPSLVNLGKRAVRCRAWRWLPGMQAMVPCDGKWVPHPTRVDKPVSPFWLAVAAKFGLHHRDDDPIPNFADPQTLGCLLSLVNQTGRTPVLDSSADARTLVAVLFDEGDQISVDGIVDNKGIEYIGVARRQADGTWRCLANVDGALCLVEVRIKA